MNAAWSWRAVVALMMVWVTTAPLNAARGGSTPNVVLILADDLGYGDLGCYGNGEVKTPRIDKLAAGGVRFTNFYANAPECTPTRTALMTGRYPQRIGGLECAIGNGNVGRYDDAIRLAAKHELGLPAQENVLVRGLKAAGYAVVGFGKWHLGYEPKFWPLKHGFDQFSGVLGGGVDYFYHCEPDGQPMLFTGDKKVEREGYVTDLITEDAVAFLRTWDLQKPFFLYLPYTAPHTPLEAPGQKPAKPRTDANWNDGGREVYNAVVERMDQGVGKVLDEIERRGVASSTLIIFMSDNGATKMGRNAPFFGIKGGTYEGGIRVPCIVRWPGVLAEGVTCDRVGITMDWTMSILKVCGASAPADRAGDGIDLLESLRSNAAPAKRALFWRQRRGSVTWRGAREGNLKYVSKKDGEKFERHLFDLWADPGEKDDLAGGGVDVARLERLVEDWEKEVRAMR